MDDLFVRALAAHVPDVRAGQPLAPHTTLKVGGPAAALVQVTDVHELTAVGDVCREFARPWFVLGRGSNVLIADSGWPGAVVMLGRGFRGVEIDGHAVVAGAAEPMPVLARHVARHGLGGLAFGVAIPGSLGGAVRMNAGAHGRELRDVLEWAEVVRLADGTQERWSVARLAFRYRSSALAQDAVVVRARLRLEPAGEASLAEEMATMRRWRRQHQPINEPSCGSVFRNPAGDSAGRLIDAAGCKGARVGGAQVSLVHANFITASPSARAADVHALIRRVQAAVAEQFGVHLRTEVVLVGFEETCEGLPA